MRGPAMVLALLACIGGAHAQTKASAAPDVREPSAEAPIMPQPRRAGPFFDAPFASTGTTTGRSLADRFTATLDVRDFGAACDGKTDDSVAFQAAMDAGAARGRLVVFSGTCLVKTRITESADPAGGLFGLHGLTGGLILTQGNDLFRYTAPATHPGYHLAKFDFRNFDITNTAARNNGIVVTVDCSARVSAGCSGAVSFIQGIHATDIGGLFHGIIVGNVHVNDNQLDRATAVTAQSFEMLEGPLIATHQEYSAGIYNQGNMVVGGNFLITVGGVQNVVNRFNDLLVGQSGVYEVHPVGIEQLQNFGNYYEATLNGIYEPVCGFCQTEENSFDGSPLGTSATYRAIAIGWPGHPQTGDVIDHNTVFGFGGARTSEPVIYADLANSGTVDHNVVDGLIGGSPACMQVGSDFPVAAGQIATISDNNCWEAGPVVLIGTNMTTRGNVYESRGRTTRIPDRN